jgi:hypothetical protein
MVGREDEEEEEDNECLRQFFHCAFRAISKRLGWDNPLIGRSVVGIKELKVFTVERMGEGGKLEEEDEDTSDDPWVSFSTGVDRLEILFL